MMYPQDSKPGPTSGSERVLGFGVFLGAVGKARRGQWMGNIKYRVPCSNHAVWSCMCTYARTAHSLVFGQFGPLMQYVSTVCKHSD